jgi:hypothetical protein
MLGTQKGFPVEKTTEEGEEISATDIKRESAPNRKKGNHAGGIQE